MADLPPASEKLRTVLDYVPCEACLSQRVEEQELLCSICHRLDREVGVRIAVTTTVLLDRPAAAAPALPVVIPPAGAPAVVLPAVVVRYLEPGSKLPKKDQKSAVPGLVEVFVEPFEEAAPPVAVAAEAAAAAAAPEPERVEWEDVASWEPPSDSFEYTGPAIVRTAEAPALVEAPPEDDFVFRPPPQEDEPPAARVEEAPAVQEVEEDWMPAEEVPVRSESSEAEMRDRWAPPQEADDAPILEEAPQEEEEIQETTIVEDEPPAVAAASEESALGDLWRLRGFDVAAERALAASSIKELAHLSGHDATELAARTGVDARRLSAWIDVADLKEEVGVPLDAALSLVAAGIAGPRGLRDTDAEDVVAKVDAFGGGATIHLKDVKRWKRRA